MALVKRKKQLKLVEGLYAQVGELFYEDGTDFEGYYHIYDKKKKYYFEGETLEKQGEVLVTSKQQEFADPMNITYTEIKRIVGEKQFEKKRTAGPISYVPSITLKSMAKGEITRYFVLQNNTSKTFEINEDQYKLYKKESNPYNANYTPVKCTWFITGKLFSEYNSAGFEISKGIYEQNKIQSELLLDEFPKFYPIVSNLTKYTIPEQENDLYSDGSFLYLPNGTAYIGKYHVHSSKGPMVGAFHVSSTHSKLAIML